MLCRTEDDFPTTTLVLNKSFCIVFYCSEITERLINMRYCRRRMCSGSTSLVFQTLLNNITKPTRTDATRCLYKVALNSLPFFWICPLCQNKPILQYGHGSGGEYVLVHLSVCTLNTNNHNSKTIYTTEIKFCTSLHYG